MPYFIISIITFPTSLALSGSMVSHRSLSIFSSSSQVTPPFNTQSTIFKYILSISSKISYKAIKHILKNDLDKIDKTDKLELKGAFLRGGDYFE